MPGATPNQPEAGFSLSTARKTPDGDFAVGPATVGTVNAFEGYGGEWLGGGKSAFGYRHGFTPVDPLEVPCDDVFVAPEPTIWIELPGEQFAVRRA